MSTSLDIVPYKPHHLRMMNIQDKQSYVLDLDPDFPENVELVSRELWTVLFEGAPIAVLGLLEIHPTCGDVFAVFAKNFAQRLKGVLRVCHQLIEDWHELRYTRLQTTVLEDFPKARRFIQSLDFKQEGYLRQFAPDGRDVFMYGKVI